MSRIAFPVSGRRSRSFGTLGVTSRGRLVCALGSPLGTPAPALNGNLDDVIETMKSNVHVVQAWHRARGGRQP
jgi:hypothetical protein